MIAFRKSYPYSVPQQVLARGHFVYDLEPTADFSPDSRNLAFCLHGKSTMISF
jgi:hypothetical protein